ncbi:uncharacterized protein LOC108143797 [Drosophila elegans]|uniref:uncharacterized protein LOC108143797 n=1 Tax=Drosophila elegans TaxID=30023 RepID=UPI0007E5EBBA|nr:uncharacterized protein LOC108143797 [Drosophila elegans]
MDNNQDDNHSFYLKNKDENLLYVAPHLGINSIDSTVEEVTKSVDFNMEQSENEFNQSESGSVSMGGQSEYKTTDQDPKIVKNRLREKYREALKRDEKLEAEAERSVNEPTSDIEERQAELKKRHKNEIEAYQVVQQRILDNFKRDMDNLMFKFDAEFSRLRKVHSELLADNQLKQEEDSAVVSGTHQP